MEMIQVCLVSDSIDVSSLTLECCIYRCQYSFEGGTIGGGHVGQTRNTSATSRLQDLRIPPVNPGRPMKPDGGKDGSNGRSSPPSYVDIAKP